MNRMFAIVAMLCLSVTPAEAATADRARFPASHLMVKAARFFIPALFLFLVCLLLRDTRYGLHTWRDGLTDNWVEVGPVKYLHRRFSGGAYFAEVEWDRNYFRMDRKGAYAHGYVLASWSQDENGTQQRMILPCCWE